MRTFEGHTNYSQLDVQLDPCHTYAVDVTLQAIHNMWNSYGMHILDLPSNQQN